MGVRVTDLMRVREENMKSETKDSWWQPQENKLTT